MKMEKAEKVFSAFRISRGNRKYVEALSETGQ